MNISKLLRFLLLGCFSMGIVEGEGGGAVVEEDPPEDDAEEGDDASEEESGSEEPADTDGGTTDEVVVTIGDQADEDEQDDGKSAAPWVTDLRRRNRELAKKNKDLEQRLQQGSAPAADSIVVGEKPKLADFNYDEDKFDKALEAWLERKGKADEQAAKKQRDAEAAQAAWQGTLNRYGKLKGELKVKDAEEAEEAAKDVLSVTQQGLILQGADNPAMVIYALGKSPKKAAELAAVTDPVKFAFAVAKLETQLKVTPRKAAPLPDKVVRGSAPVTGAVDSTLARLRVEAEKTGNYSKVHQYKQQQRQKQAQRA